MFINCYPRWIQTNPNITNPMFVYFAEFSLNDTELGLITGKVPYHIYSCNHPLELCGIFVSAAIQVYSKRNLPIVSNILKAILYSDYLFGDMITFEKAIDHCDFYVQDFAQYKEEVEKLLLLI